ncbi:S1C family serine protease [Haladaptatus sp. ZSTT2]|uniref:S1C family serine protease n=1 Tax=Haladaptatus sp. ZSTT2 TaxID=3120515 RepID=UPI00300EC986
MTQNHTYETLYRETIPSVVSLYVLHGGRYNGSGSGFVYDVVDGTGHIVTNQHVVTTAEEVDIRFSDADWRVGKVIGKDAYTDLAVVEVADLPEYAKPLPIAHENPRPGQPVAALGNPMGLEGSITAGLVSGANRSMITQDGFSIPDTVQTDAPINPGNSGGPLVTLAGEVVGVNRARGGDNIGFAISAEIVNRVVPELITNGEYRHSYLKVRTIDVSPTIAEANELAHPEGVLVADVSLGPASGALIGCHGTKEIRGQEVPVGGDIIVGVNGQPISSHEQLMRYLILETRPDEPLAVEIIRDGERLTESITLGTRPKPARRISVA